MSDECREQNAGAGGVRRRGAETSAQVTLSGALRRDVWRGNRTLAGSAWLCDGSMVLRRQVVEARSAELAEELSLPSLLGTVSDEQIRESAFSPFGLAGPGLAHALSPCRFSGLATLCQRPRLPLEPLALFSEASGEIHPYDAAYVELASRALGPFKILVGEDSDLHHAALYAEAAVGAEPDGVLIGVDIFRASLPWDRLDLQALDQDRDAWSMSVTVPGATWAEALREHLAVDEELR